MYDAALCALLIFVVTSRVISPQYLVWLVGVAAVCLTVRRPRPAPGALPLPPARPPPPDCRAGAGGFPATPPPGATRP
ncbi:hypothetical protein BG452_40840 [Streptomyces sp. CBMA123]|nr:hypothetical protein [Streptomyces sp. CBMA123]